MVDGGRTAWWTGIPQTGIRRAAFRIFRPVVDQNMVRTFRGLQGYLDNVTMGHWSVGERTKIIPYPPWGAAVGGCVHGRAARFLRSSLEGPHGPGVRLDWVFDYHYQGIAKRRMAATAIATHLYAWDHGAPPEHLGELDHRHLPHEVSDPFAASGSIDYWLAHGKVHLRSAGDNKNEVNRFLVVSPAVTGGWNGFAALRYEYYSLPVTARQKAEP
jgi:hypothetical protein